MDYHWNTWSIILAMFSINQWSAAEVNGETNTLWYSHVHKAKHIEKSVSTDKLILREPDTGINWAFGPKSFPVIYVILYQGYTLVFTCTQSKTHRKERKYWKTHSKRAEYWNKLSIRAEELSCAICDLIPRILNTFSYQWNLFKLITTTSTAICLSSPKSRLPQKPKTVCI